MPAVLPRPRAGFTLVELLVVVGIASLLATLTLPALSSITVAGRGRSAGDDLAAYLAGAAVRARTANLDVWVGLLPAADGLTVVSFDGAPEDGRPALRSRTLRGASLAAVSALRGAFRDGTLPEGDDLLETASAARSVAVPGAGTQAVRYWLDFNARGEVTARPDGTCARQLLIGLAAAPAGAAVRYPAVVEVNGLTSRNQVNRP